MVTKDLNHNWINGEKIVTKQVIDVTNPATKEIIGKTPSVTEEDVKLAIKAASDAFDSWSTTVPSERAVHLDDWANNILENKDSLARILSEEQGKPLHESAGEIEGCAQFIKWYAEEGKRIYGEIIPPSNSNQRISVIKQPIGVCGLITPWNFPGAMIARKVAPALAAGCTIITKPASETPRIAIALFDELMKTDLPIGVANLVTGKASMISNVLFSDDRVKKISFTGSTQIGKMLMAQSADQVKKLSLELGGNAPIIIFPDSDLDAAADAIVGNKFENCGQMCNGINLIYAHASIKEDLVERIVSRVKALNVGEWSENDIHIGPLINDSSIQNVEQLVEDAVQKGAKVLVGGNRLSNKASDLFYEPTVLDNVTDNMDLVDTEIFGPVAPILSFESEDDVINRSNQSPYGLAAYFFSNDINRIHRVSERLEVGMVGVNSTQLSVPQAPFGGIKESGMGREGGHYGLDGFLEIKYISLTLND
ncbi:MAG TPA: NAD-dependent succinate-semialdehyde dehydrogenase [Bacillota bacterium]|nr:NAD-dependent succinate-semialdehyde dehydrogenase [Bacillota bacterium]